jgi:hypothetical protein
MVQEWWWFNRYESVNYPVHHNRLGSQTALLECVPIQVVQHCCNTAGCVVVASSKPSCSPLD